MPLLEALWQDLRFAVRVLRKNPGFTAVAVITLALGIGANTAIFSIVNAVIFRPLPYKDSARIVVFHTKTAMFPTFTLNLSWPAFQEIRTQATSLKEAAAWWETEKKLTGASQPAVLKIASVSDGFFELLGAKAEQGRLLREDLKADQNRVVVISDTLWRTRFAKDPAVIGRADDPRQSGLSGSWRDGEGVCVSGGRGSLDASRFDRGRPGESDVLYVGGIRKIAEWRETGEAPSGTGHHSAATRKPAG